MELPPRQSTDRVSTTSIFLLYLATLMASLPLAPDLPGITAWLPALALVARWIIARVAPQDMDSAHQIMLVLFAVAINLGVATLAGDHTANDPMGLLRITQIAYFVVCSALVLKPTVTKMSAIVGADLVILLFHMSLSQDLVRSVWVISCFFLLWLCLASRHPAYRLASQRLSSLRWGLKSTIWTLTVAMPLMATFFILFPRLPLDAIRGGEAQRGGSGSTGLSNSMTIGSISDLRKSNTPAFDVDFEGGYQQGKSLYWRGIVLDDFNGTLWTGSPRSAQRIKSGLVTPASPPFKYRLTWEPETSSSWVVTLDGTFGYADVYFDRHNAVIPMRADGTHGLSTGTGDSLPGLPKPKRIHSTSASASSEWRLADINEQDMSHYLALPRGFNPRTLALGKELRRKYASDELIIATVLQKIRNEEYHYTLRPPRVGRHSIDDFLFDTRAGFCEYYAGAFVVLMRSAGIPARVVTGYLSRPAENSRVKVLQSDAHAWVEVWLGNKGWVRHDPTSAIDPSRVDPDAAGSQMEVDPNSFASYLRLKSKRFLGRLDILWRENMTQFDQSRQSKLFAQLGLDKASKGLMVIGALIAFLAAGVLWQRINFLSGLLMRLLLRRTTMQTVEHKLRKLGIDLPAGQTWRDRVEAASDVLDDDSVTLLKDIVALHEQIAYAPTGASQSELTSRLRQLCASYRPRRRADLKRKECKA